MNSHLTTMGLVLTLTACANVQSDYEASRRAYKDCLSARPLEQCINQKAAMDADAKAFNDYAARRGTTVRIRNE